MSVKLLAKLPKDEESNGLDREVAKDIMSEPHKPRVGVIVLQREGYHYSDQTAADVPEMKILRIELVTDAEEADQLVRRVQALSEVRTGNSPLPQVKGKAEAALDFDDENNFDLNELHPDDFDGPEAA